MNKCLNCGIPTPNTFCKECYEIIQERIQEPNTNYFDKKYNYQKKYKCENGIYVKSQAERTICDFLHSNNIQFEYETKCRYGEYDTYTHEINARYIVPDFYIKGPISYGDRFLKDIYIEFWGRNDEEYLTSKEYRIKVYKAHKSTLINIYPEDIFDYKKSLKYKLLNYIIYM